MGAIPLFALEKSVEQTITCETSDLTEYKGVLVKAYRNLDCVLGTTQIKYKNKPTEIKESVYLPGSTIVYFTLPESTCKEIELLELEKKTKPMASDKTQTQGGRPPKDKQQSKAPKINKDGTNAQKKQILHSPKDQKILFSPKTQIHRNQSTSFSPQSQGCRQQETPSPSQGQTKQSQAKQKVVDNKFLKSKQSQSDNRSRLSTLPSVNQSANEQLENKPSALHIRESRYSSTPQEQINQSLSYHSTETSYGRNEFPTYSAGYNQQAMQQSQVTYYAPQPWQHQHVFQEQTNAPPQYTYALPSIQTQQEQPIHMQYAPAAHQESQPYTSNMYYQPYSQAQTYPMQEVYYPAYQQEQALSQAQPYQPIHSYQPGQPYQPPEFYQQTQPYQQVQSHQQVHPYQPGQHHQQTLPEIQTYQLVQEQSYPPGNVVYYPVPPPTDIYQMQAQQYSPGNIMYYPVHQPTQPPLPPPYGEMQSNQ